MDTINIFVRNFRREKLKLTQEQLAAKIDDKRSNVANWETFVAVPGDKLLKILMLDKQFADLIRRVLIK